MDTECLNCGLREPLSLAETMAHDTRCRHVKGSREGLCPVHLIPDCSPLLNACSRLTAAS
jgi:hypothetical protein